MQYSLSNGENRVYQWDRDITITITEPENVPEVHFKWGGKAVPLPVTDQQVAIPPELMQLPKDIVFWAYTPEHTMDMALIPLEKRPKPSDYVYTPTEIRTWEQLDERIKALEDGGGISGVSSVNGQTGAVEITAKGLGALTGDDLQSATNAALDQAKESGAFDGAPGANGTTPHIGDNGNWYLGETDTGKPSRGPAGAGLDVTGAAVGQIVKIAAVDDNGAPTAWSPVDMPSSGSGGGETWEKVAETTTTEEVSLILLEFPACKKIRILATSIGGTNTSGGIGFAANNPTGETISGGEHRAEIAYADFSSSNKWYAFDVYFDVSMVPVEYQCARFIAQGRADGSYNANIRKIEACGKFVTEYYTTNRKPYEETGVFCVAAKCYGADTVLAAGAKIVVYGVKK